MHYNSDTKTLSISYEFDEELKDIPEDTKIIIFEEGYYPNYSKFNQTVDNLPQSLTYLIFGWKFNQKVDELPKNLTCLKFGGNFNQKVDKLPQSLIEITFGYNFNQTVDNLPQNLTHLIFGGSFNQKVDNLPSNLTHLTFDCSFNKKVDNLPKNLIQLTFGNDFDKKVDNLPKNLIELTFGNDFDKKVDNLPHNLKYLKLRWLFQNEIILPKNLKELSLTCNNNLINTIPEHIEKIYIYFYHDEFKKVENLPPTLKEIVIENEYYREYIKIPFGCILTIQKIE